MYIKPPYWSAKCFTESTEAFVWRYSMKKLFWYILLNLQENICVEVCNFTYKGCNRRYFSVNCRKFFRTAYLYNTCQKKNTRNTFVDIILGSLFLTLNAWNRTVILPISWLWCNLLNSSVALILKSVTRFAKQIIWLVSIWGQHWHLTD